MGKLLNYGKNLGKLYINKINNIRDKKHYLICYTLNETLGHYTPAPPLVLNIPFFITKTYNKGVVSQVSFYSYFHIIMPPFFFTKPFKCYSFDPECTQIQIMLPVQYIYWHVQYIYWPVQYIYWFVQFNFPYNSIFVQYGFL